MMLILVPTLLLVFAELNSLRQQHENGAANVMVLEGMVEVQDNTSNSIVSLQANQMITVPNVPGGLSQRDMLRREETVNPNSTDRWWDEPITAFTTSSTNLAAYVIGAAVAAVAVAGTLVLYVRTRKHKSKVFPNPSVNNKMARITD